MHMPMHSQKCVTGKPSVSVTVDVARTCNGVGHGVLADLFLATVHLVQAPSEAHTVNSHAPFCRGVTEDAARSDRLFSDNWHGHPSAHQETVT